MKNLSLPTVTLCAISSVKINETIHALRQSMKGISYARVILLTDIAISINDIEVIPIQKLDYDGYSHFVLYELENYITTDVALVVQHDGYVLRPEKWDPVFLSYDYIGAPWPPGVHFTNDGTNVRVGNGGFSLRSKKLLSAFNTLQLPFTDNGTGFYHEDGLICAYHRKRLEDAGILFAPVEIAVQFSHESDCRESVYRPFGFHRSKIVLPRIFYPLKKILRILHITL